eukprot:3096133-Prymnesium_polylepis.1
MSAPRPWLSGRSRCSARRGCCRSVGTMSSGARCEAARRRRAESDYRCVSRRVRSVGRIVRCEAVRTRYGTRHRQSSEVPCVDIISRGENRCR